MFHFRVRSFTSRCEYCTLFQQSKTEVSRLLFSSIRGLYVGTRKFCSKLVAFFEKSYDFLSNTLRHVIGHSQKLDDEGALRDLNPSSLYTNTSRGSLQKLDDKDILGKI